MHSPHQQHRPPTSGGADRQRWFCKEQLGRLALPALAALSLLATALPTSAPAAMAAGKPAVAGHVDNLLRRKAAADPNGKITVLIQRRTKNLGDTDIASVGGKVRKHLDLANVVAAEVPASRLDELARHRDVVRVSYDAPVQLHWTFPTTKLLSAYPQVLGSSRLWNGSTAPNGTVLPALQGNGVGVAVLDSGLNPLPDFNANCLSGGLRAGSVAIAPAADGSAADENGHGTFVAGVIGGRGCGDPTTSADNFQYVGIAPSVNLVAVKVADQAGMSHVSDVIRGIEWVSKNRAAYNIQVMNLSLGSADPESYQSSYLDAAVEMAWLQGITVVVAAGNGGPGAAFTAPANDPFVITVGATDDNGTVGTGDDSLAWFSQYGTTSDGFAKPDLVAPGRHIISTLSSPSSPLAAANPANILDNGYYLMLSGTSMSTPMVSGVAAQLLQAKPTLTPNQVKWLLSKTAQRLPFVGAGAGYPQAPAAVNYSGPVNQANRGLHPNVFVMQAAAQSLGWDTTGWDNVSWDNVSWDNVSWDNVSWDNVSWDNVSWDNVSWDSLVND